MPLRLWFRPAAGRTALARIARSFRAPGLRPSFFCEAEIHLFFKAVHLCDLHLYFVAEANDAAIATANQLALLRIKNVKVVFDAGEMHQAAHGEARYIDEETEVAHVDHQSGIA